MLNITYIKMLGLEKRGLLVTVTINVPKMTTPNELYNRTFSYKQALEEKSDFKVLKIKLLLLLGTR